MSLEIFSVIFWVFAIVSTYLQDKASTGEKKVVSLTTLIKIIPALSAVIFVMLFRPPTLFTILLAAAFAFCMFGDVGMEVDLIPGIGMFLIAHILYTINFLWHISTIGFDILQAVIAVVCMLIMVLYVFMLIRYLRASGPEVPPFILKAGTLYFLLISATLSSSLLLWLTSNVIFGALSVFGALIFIVSDSLIAINEFRQEITHHEFYIMPTYYLAIFLLSLGVFVFAF
ncbi:MAG: hypothetical protein AM326_04400 [Candidatus Thorarchaeota archaeon SMTZ-45]|nr:MAG: hypothetical protein AM326_04400 [Candidatus Thorarchaeota archaeon SMTZ-45]KXH74366.1 MAG: hypothetical protein AM325_05980 [Candidatus Thorarchaeota archaeon SMTZ1-45]